MYSHVQHPPIARAGRDASAEAPLRTRASVSFGTPVGDNGVTRLDLNELLIGHPAATFVMRIEGDALLETGIASGDLVLIDRAIPPTHGHIVVAVVDGEFMCRRLSLNEAALRLQAPNGSTDLVAGEGVTIQLWGVVTRVIKTLPV